MNKKVFRVIFHPVSDAIFPAFTAGMLLSYSGAEQEPDGYRGLPAIEFMKNEFCPTPQGGAPHQRPDFPVCHKGSYFEKSFAYLSSLRQTTCFLKKKNTILRKKIKIK